MHELGENKRLQPIFSQINIQNHTFSGGTCVYSQFLNFEFSTKKLPTPVNIYEATVTFFLPLQKLCGLRWVLFLPLQTVSLVKTSAFNRIYWKLTYKTNLFQGKPRYIWGLKLLNLNTCSIKLIQSFSLCYYHLKCVNYHHNKEVLATNH